MQPYAPAWGLLLLVLAAAPVAADATAFASVEPATAAPGQTLHLLFVVNASGPVDVALQRQASCAMTGPGEPAAAPCASGPQLLDASLFPGARAYAWDVNAPATPGTYTVAFSRTDVLSLPPGAADARATFTVAPRGEGDQSVGLLGLSPGATSGAPEAGPARDRGAWSAFTFLFSGTTVASAAAPAAGADSPVAARVALSSGAAAATLILLVLANRAGGLP